MHAWNGYATKCFGQDELVPMTGSCKNWLGGGVTIVDSLDTLIIMGLKEEYKRARDWVAEKFNVRNVANKMVSFFETVIRHVRRGLEQHTRQWRGR